MLYRYPVMLWLAVLAYIVCGSTLAKAEVISAASGSEVRQVSELATGDQLVLDTYTGSLEFAGAQVDFDRFSGVLGYATEAAYVVAIDGSASIDTHRAKRGRMLLIAPFGNGIVQERFDARRLLASLAESPKAAEFSSVLRSLGDLAGNQGRGVWLGRLTRTDFNVATMGSKEDELARRSRVGGTAIRAARYMTAGNDTPTEQVIVEKFVAALTGADAAAAGQFLDPLPYGNGAIRESDRARHLAAQALISQHDWSGFSEAKMVRSGDLEWTAQGRDKQAVITIRRTSEFAFIETIQVGE